jgi:tRNA G10  N-methylase Trm11
LCNLILDAVICDSPYGRRHEGQGNLKRRVVPGKGTGR